MIGFLRLFNFVFAFGFSFGYVCQFAFQQLTPERFYPVGK